MMHTESGRSLVEMMGTLAIMGILAIAGVWMYNSAMDKLKANTIINEAQKRAVVVAGQIGFQGRTDPSLAEFSDNTFSGGTFLTDVTTDGLYQQFGIQVSNVPKRVCQNILNSVGNGTSIRRLSAIGNTTEAITTCAENNSFLLIYNNDMSSGGGDVVYCDNSTCQTVCGQCIIENGTPTCINECPAGSGQCSTDQDCSGECVTCVKEGNATTGTCQSCTRVAYLESTGTQYIDTGILPKKTVEFELSCYYNTVFQPTVGECIFGMRYTTGSQWRYMVSNFASSNYGYGNAGYASFGNNRHLQSTESGIHKYAFSFKKGFFSNGHGINKSVNIKDDVSPVEPIPSSWTLFLFAGNYPAETIRDAAKGKVYSLKIWDNGSLVRDFVPVLDPKGVPAMYDKATKAFFYNAGTGTFKTDKSSS